MPTEPEQLTFLTKPIIIGIAGCSGSGKTTLARELSTQLDAALFPFDFYYRDLAHLPVEERALQNFDHPNSLEHELLVEHVRDLSEGKSVQRPVYDFSTHSRVPQEYDELAPRRYVIVEGILALHYADLLPLYDFSIYVDAPNEVCLNRRIYRDMRERGRTEESVRIQFDATAKPMAEQYVIPSQSSASLTVQGTENLDWSIEVILRQLHELGLP
ncbi:MAG: uridine kinase [Acidobacteriaceae bacterium]|nr:uridine kinase [Acidobacteriaceae bacterium]